MPTKILKIATAVAAFSVFSLLRGANLPTVNTPKPDTSVAYLEAMSAALALREDAALQIASGQERVADTIVRLKAHPSPYGLKIDRDAEFSFAAVDIGQRLLVKGKFSEAEALFLAAEFSLEALVVRTDDKSAKNKAAYLQKLAAVRADYLNKPTEAKRDIEAAIALQPDDKYLQAAREQFGKERGASFSATTKN